MHNVRQRNMHGTCSQDRSADLGRGIPRARKDPKEGPSKIRVPGMRQYLTARFVRVKVHV